MGEGKRIAQRTAANPNMGRKKGTVRLSPFLLQPLWKLLAGEPGIGPRLPQKSKVGISGDPVTTKDTKGPQAIAVIARDPRLCRDRSGKQKPTADER